ncbi:MAG: L,D-transpeptidase [Verrucomicrobia bacterium]|nr:L,D-transpeptidase [Verrucomicrobiota bacterium]
MLLSASRIFAASEPAVASILISVPDQKMVLLQNGTRIAEYPVSTSRYGVGDRFGSYATPLGQMEVADKIGQGFPLGTVFKSRRPTGEVLRPNAPGRDPIVTRILWLRGTETATRNAYDRDIYIHGTPVERLIGRPVSYGCVRMRSRDVAELFGRVAIGTPVCITKAPLQRALSTLASN